MKISIALWKHNQLKDGTYPLKIKVFDVIDGKKRERYYPTEIYLKPNQWDATNKTVKSHPHAVDYNIKIRKALNNLESQKAKEEPINVKKATIGDSFIHYYRNYLETIIKVKHSASHYKKHFSILTKLEAYNPNITFSEINRDFVNKYDVYLIGLKNSPLTRHDNFKRIKFIFDEAVEEKIVSSDDSPFKKFRVIVPKKKKTRLTYKEIIEIENSYFKENSNQWHTKNYWLFSFYCAGIRFGDLCRLKKSNIVDGYLEYTMNKSKNNPNPQYRRIKLMPQALAIAKIYLNQNNKYLFGIIDHLPKDKFEVLELINKKNSIANNNLRKIAKSIETSVKLSFHTSRNSFADYCRKKKITEKTIQDLLGHEKFATTEEYMKGFDEEETDEAMDKLFG